MKKESIKEAIFRSTDRLRRNYQIIKLNNNAFLPFEMDELKYNYNGITTNEVLKGIGVK